MASDSKLQSTDRRRREILAATLHLLRDQGAAVSTAQIAAQAHCSKETLYNWFDNREGIMETLITEHAKSMERALIVDDGEVENRLKTAAARLLDLATGEATLVVNRMAMAATNRNTAKLGAQVIESWNANVVRPVVEIMIEARTAGLVVFDDEGDAFDVFYGLLMGDVQRRLLLGSNDRMDGSDMRRHADRAVLRWFRVFGPET